MQKYLTEKLQTEKLIAYGIPQISSNNSRICVHLVALGLICLRRDYFEMRPFSLRAPTAWFSNAICFSIFMVSTNSCKNTSSLSKEFRNLQVYML